MNLKLTFIDTLQESIPWQAKVALLVLGQFWYPLGVALLLRDGWFHYSTPLDRLKLESPDWIVAQEFNKKGLSEFKHKVMGVVLISSSLLYILINFNFNIMNNLIPSVVNFNFVYTKLLYPAFLVMITAAIIIKNQYTDDETTPTPVANF